MKKLLVAAAALLDVPGAAQAAPPNPFGHACTPQNAVFFCPTASDAERVPRRHGRRRDAPAERRRPVSDDRADARLGRQQAELRSDLPGGNGGASYHYNNVYFAQQGYAVLTPSARGFGRSC
jgi:hypothetical protein